MDEPEGFKIFVNQYIRKHSAMFSGKVVVDVPAGSGVTSRALLDAGAKVLAFDLFPEYFRVRGLRCRRANISDGLPLKTRAADIVICQEGIEHFSDQFKAFREFNRLLKVGGKLLLTTPNHSNLRAKLSHLLAESERFGSLMPPNEIDSVWMVNQKVSREVYFGHIFLIGIQKLRILARLSGFRIDTLNFEGPKPTSVLLLPFLYPLILMANWLAYRKNLRTETGVPLDVKKQVYKEQLLLNINPRILVDGTLFVEFVKIEDADDVAATLRSRHKNFEVTT